MVELRDVLKLYPGLPKPREKRWTVCMEGGLSLRETEELCDIAGEFVDVCKLLRAVSVLMPPNVLRKKLEIYKAHQIRVQPGGILFEIAALQKKVNDFCRALVKTGFDSVEISENIASFAPQERVDFIRRAKAAGLDVIYEWGRKVPEKQFTADEVAQEIAAMLKAGAHKVILERSELDHMVRGDTDVEPLLLLAGKVGIENLVLEAQNPGYPAYFIKLFGPDVNLANIDFAIGGDETILPVEEQRRGLGRPVGYRFIEKGADPRKEWWK